jgi:hypothetical protein
MKSMIVSLFSIAISVQANAQDKRSGILGYKEYSIGIATGIDYSVLPIKLTYKQGFSIFNYKYPVEIGTDVTAPLFAFDLNDIRIRIISETTILRKRKFEIRGGIDPLIVNVKMKTETMSSLGADFHIFTGFTNDKWNTGMEVNYNQIISTYIKHTEKYKKYVYAGVVDGWYRNTASNIRIGVLVNRSFNRINLYLNGGISKTGQFKDYLFVPTMYLLAGMNYTFNK